MTYLGKSIKGGLATDQGNTQCSSAAKMWSAAGTGRTRRSVELPLTGLSDAELVLGVGQL